MALERSCPSAGDIGDDPEQYEPDPDLAYERRVEQRAGRGA